MVLYLIEESHEAMGIEDRGEWKQLAFSVTGPRPGN